MSRKRVLVVGGVFLVLAAVWLGLRFLDYTFNSSTQNTSTTKVTEPTTTATTQAPTDGKLYIGNRDAKVTIVEYADYKCPKCGEFHQKAGKEVRTKYVETGIAKIEFRPFPVFGEDAGLALYGSYCANEQGRFTAYHDAVFSHMWETYYKKGNLAASSQPVLTPAVLSAVAVSAGLEKTAFDTCLGDQTHKTAYTQAVNLAASDSVNGTPTFIIGEEKIVGPQPFSIFAVLLDLEQTK